MSRPSWYLAIGIGSLFLVPVTWVLNSERNLAPEVQQASLVSDPAKFESPAPNPSTAVLPPADPLQHTMESLDAFQRFTTDTLDKLPTEEDLRNTPNRDPHFPGPEIMQMSPYLGKIADTLRANPELISQGIEFYRRCATADGVLTPVRVICLQNLRYWTAKHPDSLEVEPGDYPEDVWQLASRMPSVPPSK